MNIIRAIKDENLFKPFLADANGDISSWANWITALRCVYGLPVRNPLNKQLVKICTGRDAGLLPKNGFSTSLFLTGRRSGKSRVAACVAGFEAALSGREKLLARGEIGIVSVISPTRFQSQIVKSYVKALFESTPLLAAEIVEEQKEGFTISNKVRIQILVGDYRSVRGFTLLALVVDEAAFFGLTEESKVKSDSELVRAVKPSLATVGGRLLAISSPYAKKGFCYSTYKKHFGNNAGSVLVWNCPSRTMNPTLPQSIVDDALAEDLAAAKSEYLGEFRDDICLWLVRDVIEAVVRKGRKELLPKSEHHYFAFVDVSGGRNDDSAIAIGHLEQKTVVLDFAKAYTAPHSPYTVIGLMCEELRRFRITSVTGDNYAAEFVANDFSSNGIRYTKSELSKSGLYLELLPRICSRAVELLDDEKLISQLSSLERRTRSGGRDSVDAPPQCHDDLANAVAGVSYVVGARRKKAGVF